MKKGIDVSTFQKNVDYGKVKNDNISFVLIRSSYGKANEDEQLKTHIAGFNSVNIPILGLYHFSYALTAKDAKKEADFAVKLAKKYKLPKSTYIFYDFEYGTVRYAYKKGVTLRSAQCIEFTKAFCERVKKLGYKAGVYANLDYCRNMYNDEILSKYPLWLAQYNSDLPKYTCIVKQYSSKGKVKGISGNVDMNFAYGSNIIPEAGKKTNEEIAFEVSEGKWGNGADRKIKLAEAGYSYTEIQKEVNYIMVARDVWKGKWGNGLTRKSKLKKAGYDWNKVQYYVKKVKERGV